jgi:hypothetical protein
MAARLNKRQQEQSKAAISSTQLMKRLQEHALSGPDREKMTPSQVRAAEILLRKLVPDLSSVTHSGEMEHQVRLSVTLTPTGKG